MSPPASSPTGVRVEVVRLDRALPLPSYARPGDAGLDLHAADAVTIVPGGRTLVSTGVAVAIPPGFAGFVLPRSGLALRHGLGVLNAPGLIDAGYRGEIKVLLVNHDPVSPVTIERGDRVAQLVIQAVERVHLVEVDALPDTDRGAGGFGSTG
jgi:dUTP pyrophosphatase